MSIPERKTFYLETQLSEHMGETPEGFLVCYDVPIARIGEYLYKGSEVPVEAGKDGLVKVLREPEDIFAEEAIKSFEGKPVTINHPNNFVTPDNWKALAHGHLQNARRGEREQSDLVIGDLIITTEDAIKLVRAGLRQVSCGYDAQYAQIEPGLAKQKEIIGNHIALVVKGRAGNRCAIMDKACECCGNCMCKDKNNLDKEDKVKMDAKSKGNVRDVLCRIFPKLKPVLDSMKDEDLVLGEGEMEAQGGGNVEAAESAAAQAKEAAIQAVEAAKEASAAAEAAKAGGGETANLSGAETDEGEEGDPIAALNQKLDSLTAMVQSLIDALQEGEGGEEENLEGGESEEGGEESNEEEMHDEGEDPNVAEKMAKTTTDAMWRDVMSRAEIIAPGIVATKPKATDLKKAITSIKRQALSQAMTKDTAELIKPLIGKNKVATLTEDALDTIFIAASQVVSAKNNAKVQKKSMQMKDLSCHNELADMNAKNRAFWAKK
jgi:hypothetical protein